MAQPDNRNMKNILNTLSGNAENYMETDEDKIKKAIKYLADRLEANNATYLNMIKLLKERQEEIVDLIQTPDKEFSKEYTTYIENLIMKRIDARFTVHDAKYMNIINALKEHQESLKDDLGISKKEISKTHKVFVEDLINKTVEDRIAKLEQVYTTKTRIKEAQTITSTENYKLLSINGKGMINQILLAGNNNNFGIFIMLDDNLLFDHNYSFFATYQDYLENISAFQDGSKYYLSFRTLNFLKSVDVQIKSASSTVFDVILAKMTIKEETPS